MLSAMARRQQKTLQQRRIESAVFFTTTFSKDPDAAQDFVGSREPDVAAYAMVANTLLNLDELISRP